MDVYHGAGFPISFAHDQLQELYRYPLISMTVRIMCMFTNRIVIHGNSLPNSIVTAPTVATFKQRFDDFWKQSEYGDTHRPVA